MDCKEYCSTHEAGLPLKSECFTCLLEVIDRQKYTLDAYEARLIVYDPDWLRGFKDAVIQDSTPA